MLQRPPSKIELKESDKGELTARRERIKSMAKKKSNQLPLSPVKAVEVKLRLKDKAAHDKVVALLQDQQTHLYRQHNYFYDGPNGELSRNRTILRVRWFNEDEKVVITVKGRMAVQDGVGRAVEDESEVDVATAKHFHEDPARILQLQLPVIQALKAKVQVDDLKSLGGFKNVRKVCSWHGETLEVDETQYDWGTVYEIECETPEPEAARKKLDEFLQHNRIEYKSNTTTKFSNFINRTLD